MPACFLGDDANMDNYHTHPELSSLTDVTPTWMSQLEWDTLVDPTVYSNGMSIAIPTTGRDRTQERVTVCNARYFPRKNKINALIDRDSKMWFRVSSFDRATKKMVFHPEFLTNLQDEQSECDLSTMRERFYQLRNQDAEEPEDTQAAEEEDKCKNTDKFWRYLESFSTDFWQFLELDPKG